MKWYLMVICSLLIVLQPVVHSSVVVAQEIDSEISLDDSDDIFDDEDFDDLLQGPLSVKLKLEQPTIELTYSSTTTMHKDLPDKSVAGFGIIEGRIGATRKHITKKQQNQDILKERTNYLYFGGGETSLGAMSTSNGGVTSGLWRFGIGGNTARGWKFGDVGLLLTHGSAMSWSDFTFDDTAAFTKNPVLKDYHDAFRFGKMVEGGIGVKFSDDIALTVGYEQTSVFHRHLVFYWLTSEVIEGIAQGAAEAFIRRIEISSPKSAPIVAFLLHNGIGFGASMLRKNKMNWPFDTTPALLYGGFKVNLSVRF